LEESEKERIRNMNVTREYIYRTHDEVFFAIETPRKVRRDSYPWEHTYIGNQIRINKEFFRCKGSNIHKPITKQTHYGPSYVFDCGGGGLKHSLPLKNGKEYIYPALIELLNYIQEKTRKKVVITCGHRCPTHNAYADNAPFNRTSKHMIGAEVDFYVNGLEWSPKTVISLIKAYYRDHAIFGKDPAFYDFKRWEERSNVTTPPWYNKEIFIKLFKRDEGRDFDNDHCFPYVCIQLKWDREEDKMVSYSWSSAFNNYLRY
jgi:hypothetical protein